MIVTFPMYDYPESQTRVNALWDFVQKILRSAGLTPPPQLDRSLSAREAWSSDALWLTQCCGVDLASGTYPLRYLATPDPGLADVPAGTYRSWIVTRARDAPAWRDDPRAAARAGRAIVNERVSFSGGVALRRHLAAIDADPERATPSSGAHRRSLEAIREGRADFAAIDAVSWRELATTAPRAIDGLEIVAATPAVPAPPLAVGPAFAEADIERARRALTAEATAFPPPWRSALRLDARAYAALCE